MEQCTVRLVSTTNPEIEGIETAEELIGYCARVSNPSNQQNTDTMPKLLAYCIRNKHWSIFEMASMCVEIKTSRAIAQQILRHRSFSFQEFSQRYAAALDMVSVDLRQQATKNRQSSTEVFDPMIRGASASRRLEMQVQHAQELYDDLIEAGVAKECARMVLPLTTQTTMYMHGTVRSWLSYFNVRLDPHTQKEHQEIALEIAKIFAEQFPHSAEATEFFHDYTGDFM